MFAGSDQTFDGYARYGRTLNQFGFLLESLIKETDGFKTLDQGAAQDRDRNHSSNTGFELQDFVGKARWSSRAEASLQQLFELKLGDVRQTGNETYLGLTEDDFLESPYRRYIASSQDRIDTDHQQFQLRHFLRVGTNADLTSTIYRNDFFRNWFKNESTHGVSNGQILAEPDDHSLELAWLRGELDSPPDVFVLRNNRRRYRAEGFQTALALGFDQDTVTQQLEVGLRVHRDYEDRFQEDDRFGIRDGALMLTSQGLPGSQSNRLARAEALAVFVEDRVQMGRWTFTPGMRLERIRTERLDYVKGDPLRLTTTGQRENSMTEWIPGLGASFQLTDRWVVLAGAHRGFAPPSPSSREQVEPEESSNFELGLRYFEGRKRFEVIGFVSDYSNLLGADTASGGGMGTEEQWNGGAVDLGGLEASFSNRWTAPRFDIVASANYTFTRGEFSSSFETGFADWAPFVEAGDHLPYLAEHQFSIEAGLQAPKWELFLSANYFGEMRTRAGQGAIPSGEGIEQRTVFDLAGAISLGERLRLRLKVRNLSDEVYVAARRPYGLRPGLPRTLLAGFELGF